MSGKTTYSKIVEYADDLFYERGYEATSFADIAGAVGISRGNFYHHFKLKDDILDAVISQRLARTKAMLERWETESDDACGRIRSFINILITNRTKIMLYGCPVGTLCTELAKLEHAAQGRAADVFSLIADWLTRQFSTLGWPEPERQAMHVLARSQGIATLASAFHDEDFIRHEVEMLCGWLDRGPARPVLNDERGL